ncbi:MAG: acyl-CoA dehydrogenase [Methanobacteriota archaeon]|nr:MAG: acyl-CoA dehydrogenase [Euryarchaeota archaeon]|tara:strand:+ start:1 stop:1167 length:1167 start_codon:yes stop_codon:yes gene_type:complete
MSRYEGVDFYNIEKHLTEEEIMVRDLVRDWVDEKVIPIIEDYYTKGTFPMELISEIGEMGLFGCNLEGYECAGLSNVAYGLVCQELERGDSAIRSCVSVQGSLSMYPIHAFGTEEQKQKYLPGMAQGKLIGCFGLTEPDHGSDPGGMETKAVDDGDSYVLNGAKMWITNGTVADLAIVWAKLEGKIRGFIVEKSDSGFSAPEMKGKHSLRASITSELVFQDCKIPKDRVLPEVQGLKGPLSCLTQARYGITWGSIGAAMGCFHSSVDYSKSRIMFKKPIASFQLVQNKLAWMLREITKGQLLAYHLGRAKDSGEATPEMVSLGKMNNVDVAIQIARMARDIHGANGILNEYPIMRHMANLESVYTYEGTHDIHNLILGRWITGIQAFE